MEGKEEKSFEKSAEKSDERPEEKSAEKSRKKQIEDWIKEENLEIEKGYEDERNWKEKVAALQLELAAAQSGLEKVRKSNEKRVKKRKQLEVLQVIENEDENEKTEDCRKNINSCPVQNPA